MLAHDLSLAALPLAELLQRFAARTPAPGGGSGAATGCALAAALVEMAARFDPTPEAEATVARAAALRGRLLQLADRELEAYAPVLDALSLPAGDVDREVRLAQARSAAADPPLQIAAIATELAALGAETAQAGSPHLTGDALVGILLAEAACRAAVALVELNLDAPADPRRSRAAELARAAAAARDHALAAAVHAGGAV